MDGSVTGLATGKFEERIKGFTLMNSTRFTEPYNSMQDDSTRQV
jgi:hypothetical protein